MQGRFKAKLVEDHVYLLAVTRYIHLNPIKIAACRKLPRGERLRRLERLSWSSYDHNPNGGTGNDVALIPE